MTLSGNFFSNIILDRVKEQVQKKQSLLSYSPHRRIATLKKFDKFSIKLTICPKSQNYKIKSVFAAKESKLSIKPKEHLQVGTSIAEHHDFFTGGGIYKLEQPKSVSFIIRKIESKQQSNFNQRLCFFCISRILWPILAACQSAAKVAIVNFYIFLRQDSQYLQSTIPQYGSGRLQPPTPGTTWATIPITLSIQPDTPLLILKLYTQQSYCKINMENVKLMVLGLSCGVRPVGLTDEWPCFGPWGRVGGAKLMRECFVGLVSILNSINASKLVKGVGVSHFDPKYSTNNKQTQIYSQPVTDLQN